MTFEPPPFDAAKYLGNPEAQAAFLHDALETGDAGYIAHALDVITRARGGLHLDPGHEDLSRKSGTSPFCGLQGLSRPTAGAIAYVNKGFRSDPHSTVRRSSLLAS